RDRFPAVARLSERIAGFSARRRLPQWRSDRFRDPASPAGPQTGGEVVLFADTFNRYFEPENIDAAISVLAAAPYQVRVARRTDRSARPLCCGRTFLAIGRVDEARREAQRVLAAVAPFLRRGMPVVGLEPSCILGFRDEVPAMIRSEDAGRLAAQAL